MHYKLLATLLFLSTTSLFSIDYTITCIGDSRSSQISTMDYTFGMEDDPDFLPKMYGEADPTCCDFPFWDITSPVCGGDGADNVMLSRGCYTGGTCYDVILGDTTENQMLAFDSETNEYYNNVIMVNGLPCLDSSVTKMGVGVYNWNDNSNFGIASVNIKELTNNQSATYTPTSEEATLQKSICVPIDPNAPIDYTAQLNEIITNTAPNSISADKLTNIDNRQQTLDDTLNNAVGSKTLSSILDTTSNTDTFSTTFETTIENSFTSYSDIFGFGGYGVAPAPITFTFLNRSFTLFDIGSLDSVVVELIRNTFLIFAYLWGFIIVFRGD